MYKKVNIFHINKKGSQASWVPRTPPEAGAGQSRLPGASQPRRTIGSQACSAKTPAALSGPRSAELVWPRPPPAR